MGKRKDVECGLCGRTIAHDKAVHSQATGNSYCAEDKGCAKRTQRRRRAEARQ